MDPLAPWAPWASTLVPWAPNPLVALEVHCLLSLKIEKHNQGFTNPMPYAAEPGRMLSMV